MMHGKTFAVSLAAMVSALAGTPAHADSRLVSHEYNADEVVRIDGRLGVQATIGFADSEFIENVAVGDSQKWQITPNKRANLLFVKPLEAGARTNMTVVTNKRTYFFDLATSAKTKPLYMLRFTYKDEDKAADATVASASLNPDEQAAISGDPVAAPADPALLNFSWTRKGDSRLLPARIYDDGEATYLLWSEKQAVPAILVKNEQGVEGPVNYAVRGNTIVIDAVPSLIVLRTGKASATLENMRGKDSAYAVLPPGLKQKRPLYADASGLPGAAAIWRN